MAIQDHEDPIARPNANEQSPLLGEEAQSQPSKPQEAKTFQRKVVFLMLLIVLAIDVPSYLQSIPRVRLYEIVYCRQYYQEVDPRLIGPGGVVNEALCKVNIIQSQVALLIGWLRFFDFAPGIFLAVPFSMFADKYGRKRLLALNMLSFALREAWVYLVLSFPTIFPIKLVWLEAMFQLLGGGSLVASSLIYVICNDVTAQSRLSTVFLRLDAMAQLSLVIAPLVAASLMKINPWIPVTLGLALQILAIPITLFVPETLSLAKEPDETPEASQRQEHSEDDMSSSPSSSLLHDQKPHPPFSLGFLRSHLFIFLGASSFLFQNWRILFIASTYPPRMMLNDLDNLLVQYIPKRFHSSLSDTNFVWSLEAVCNTVVLFLVVPLVSSLLLKKLNFKAEGKDIWIARVGLLLFAVFVLAQGFAPTAWAFVVATLATTLGAGTGASMRALMTSYVKVNEVARLYTTLAIVETATLMLSGPFTAEIFTVGLNKGGVWQGLPWMVIGTLLAVATGAMWVARLDGGGKEKIVGEGNGGMEEGLERAVEGRGIADSSG